MHSRIFQVNSAPIEVEDYITMYDYIYGELSISDYVDESDNRNNDVEWLKYIVSDRGIEVDTDDNGNEYIVIENKEEYFREAFREFEICLKTLAGTTLSDFAEGKHCNMYRLNEAYEEKYSFYVNIEGCTIPFDAFVRECEPGIKYYIGGTLDYHY